MNDSVVVYYFKDPAYRGDLSAIVNELKSLSYRIVQGDKADELLLLLQVGRPVAIIYTLASQQVRVSVDFQMIARRALDLLVPIILVGPDDPRDGVVCIHPKSRRDSYEKHYPYRNIVELIRELDVNPPSTPSRPPERVQAQTLGKGTSLGSPEKNGPSISEVTEELEREIVSSQAQSITSERTRGDSAQKIESTRRVKKIKVEKQLSSSAISSGNKRLRMMAMTMAFIIFAAMAISIVLILVDRKDSSAGKTKRESVRKNEQTGLVHDAASSISFEEESASQKRETVEPGPTESKGEFFDGGQLALESSGATFDGPKQRSKHRPGFLMTQLMSEDTNVRFPGHFRNGSATFWFSSSEEEDFFSKQLKSVADGTLIQIVGLATIEEVYAGYKSLPQSRAWAVEKYLVRKGFDSSSLKTEVGLPVSSRSDHDENGWPQNRWVVIHLEKTDVDGSPVDVEGH